MGFIDPGDQRLRLRLVREVGRSRARLAAGRANLPYYALRIDTTRSVVNDDGSASCGEAFGNAAASAACSAGH